MVLLCYTNYFLNCIFISILNSRHNNCNILCVKAVNHKHTWFSEYTLFSVQPVYSPRYVIHYVMLYVMLYSAFWGILRILLFYNTHVIMYSNMYLNHYLLIACIYYIITNNLYRCNMSISSYCYLWLRNLIKLHLLVSMNIKDLGLAITSTLLRIQWHTSYLPIFIQYYRSALINKLRWYINIIKRYFC